MTAIVYLLKLHILKVTYYRGEKKKKKRKSLLSGHEISGQKPGHLSDTNYTLVIAFGYLSR